LFEVQAAESFLVGTPQRLSFPKPIHGTMVLACALHVQQSMQEPEPGDGLQKGGYRGLF